MSDLLPYLIGGLANGALYGLLALGFVLVYRATSVVNFAIGEFLLVGAYLTYTFALLMPLYLAILAALLPAFLFGVLVERGFVRPLLGRSVVAVIMATIGLAAALDGGVQLVWGPDLKYLPGNLPHLGFQAGEVFVSSRAVWNLLLALPLGLGLLWLLRRSRYGILVRAISEREVAALALGIPTARLLAAVWGISALLATLAGALLAVASGVGHHLVFLGLKVFPVAILGGLESVGGALLAGLLLGVLEALSQRHLEPFLPGFTEALPFLVVLLVLLIRPYGLLGERQIERV
ncbi:branched-chain amino acid ABC transporter permease [Thermus thermamylovorans]|uniref:Branched-chain amino acid ABC transporter permease n=1 Tax=Thermus thermamylovorans TaxID=2509362 RepID=A0A4Q9B953_9DEIN|nr:branched-chain amino acid ABC transporter permease [Thermus thermamylovorans]TBH21868.1 branched-chain amino acid ABC transporter permease [Thermus thermamylovorans]